MLTYRLYCFLDGYRLLRADAIDLKPTMINYTKPTMINYTEYIFVSAVFLSDEVEPNIQILFSSLGPFSSCVVHMYTQVIVMVNYVVPLGTTVPIHPLHAAVRT